MNTNQEIEHMTQFTPYGRCACYECEAAEEQALHGREYGGQF